MGVCGRNLHSMVVGVALILTMGAAGSTVATAQSVGNSHGAGWHVAGTILPFGGSLSAESVATSSDDGAGSWALRPNEDGTVDIAVSGLRLERKGGDVMVMSGDGRLEEVLPKRIVLENGIAIDLHYSVIGHDKAKLVFTSESPSLQKPRWRCYTDPINAGIAGGCITGSLFGGIGCGPGAVTGAIGGLATAAFSCAK